MAGSVTVTPLEGKLGFGCRVTGLALSELNDASFAVLAEAFTSHQVVVISGGAPEPEHEVALYRRLEALWDGPQQETAQTPMPATQPKASAAAAAARGCSRRAPAWRPRDRSARRRGSGSGRTRG